MARQRLEATTHHQIMEDIKELEATITDSEETMRASEARAKEMKAKADLLQDKVCFCNSVSRWPGALDEDTH